MKKLLLLLLLLVPDIAQGQTSTKEVMFVTADPTSCSSSRIYYNRTNRSLWGNSGTGNNCSNLNSGLAGGDALTSAPLSQFAATTSAELAGVLSNETGTGVVVFSISPALTGVPTAPTAAAGTNTTQIATTAHVLAERTNTKTLTNTTLTTPVINSPTGIVKADVGLANVDDTSDATKNAATATLTNKTMSGASNTFTNLPAAGISGVIPMANLATGTPDGTKFIRDDGTLQTISGGGDALTTNPLSQFAATTSAQLAGVISNETGTGALVFAGSPTFTGTVVIPTPFTLGATSVTTTGAELNFVAGVTSGIQTQIDGRQPLDSDLTALAGLTATTDNFIVSVASAWASRTPAQVKTTLALDNVDNTSDATKNSATATLTNKTISGASNTLTNLPAANISGVIPIANLATGTPDGSKFIRDDGTLQAIPGGGDALTTNPLSQFAVTTSAQLAGVMTNETGTGVLVFGTAPNITSPTGIVKGDVGLGNVDNTSDATKNAATVSLTNKTIDGDLNTIIDLPASTVFKTGTNIPTAIIVTGTVTNTRCLRVDGTGNIVTHSADCGSGGTVTVVASGSLTSTALVTGGGTTTLQTPSATATLDASGNISTPGSITLGAGSAAAGTVDLGEGTAASLVADTFSIYAPTNVAVAGLAYVLPGAAASGLMRAANSSGVMTITHDGGISHLASSNSADLRGVLSDETGTGAAVFVAGNIGAGTATTPSANDNSTLISTTAYVQTELTAYAADTKTFTNTTIDTEGTGNAFTSYFFIEFIAAGVNGSTGGPGLDLPVANGPAVGVIAGSNIGYGVLDFDATSDEAAQGNFWLPADWTGSIDLDIDWQAAATTGSVVFGLQTACVADAETNDPALNTAQTVTDATKGTTNQRNTASITTVTVTGCAANERFHFRFFRDADNGSDDMAGDARLKALRWKLRRAQ